MTTGRINQVDIDVSPSFFSPKQKYQTENKVNRCRSTMLVSQRKHEIMQRSTPCKSHCYGCDCVAYNFSLTEIVIPEQQCSTGNPQLEKLQEEVYNVALRCIEQTHPQHSAPAEAVAQAQMHPSNTESSWTTNNYAQRKSTTPAMIPLACGFIPHTDTIGQRCKETLNCFLPLPAIPLYKATLTPLGPRIAETHETAPVLIATELIVFNSTTLKKCSV